MNRDLKLVTDWVRTPESLSPPDVLGAAVRLSSPKRRPSKVVAVPGKSKEDRDAERAAKYETAKIDAAIRAGARFVSDEDGACSMVVAPRCEEYTDGRRCREEGTDPDHVLGGAYRKECERLGADGLMVRCRGHHDQKHANLPTRRYQLDQAKEHAIRISSPPLLRMVEKAIARDEMKHPEARTARTA